MTFGVACATGEGTPGPMPGRQIQAQNASQGRIGRRDRSRFQGQVRVVAWFERYALPTARCPYTSCRARFSVRPSKRSWFAKHPLLCRLGTGSGVPSPVAHTWPRLRQAGRNRSVGRGWVRYFEAQQLFTAGSLAPAAALIPIQSFPLPRTATFSAAASSANSVIERAANSSVDETGWPSSSCSV